jgi:streptogramin lyase
MKKIKLLFIAIISFANSNSQNWKYIRPSNTGLGGETYICLVTDQCGNKWTGGFLPFWSEGSVTRFNDSVYTNWSNFEGYLPADRVYDVDFDSHGEPWIAANGVGNGIAHGGLVHYDGTSWTQYTTANTPLPEDDLRGVAVDHNDNIWITFWGTGNGVGGVAKYDHNIWTIYTPQNSSLPTYAVTDIVVDVNNHIWVGSELGLAEFDGTNWNVYTNSNSGLSNYVINDVEYDKTTNKLYVATGVSIDVFDGANWSHINSSNSPVSSTGLYEVDAKGNDLIIGTIGGTYKCYVYHNGNWTSTDEPDHCYDVRIDNDNNFWMAGNGYIERFNGNSWQEYSIKNSGLTSMFNDDVFIDSRNRAWFSSNDNGGVNVYDCMTWKDYNPYNSNLFANPVSYTGSATGVTEDSQGDIWMVFNGTLGAVVQVPHGNINDTASWIVWDNSNSGITLQSCKRIAADHNGNVWVGYDGACSVSRFSHSTNSWTNFNLYQLGQTTCGAGSGINSIRVDDSSNVWICGVAGLAKYDQLTWTFYSYLNTPMQGQVMDIAFDNQQSKWIATESGLYRLNNNTWTQFDSTNTPMVSSFCNSVVVDHNNIVWVASQNYISPAGSLCSFDGVSWTSYTPVNSGLQDNSITRLAVDTSNNLWVLSATHGAAIFNLSGVIGFDCIDKSLQNCSTTSIKSVENSSVNAQVFPNPNNGRSILTFNSNNSENCTMRIFDISGNEINFPANVHLKTGENKLNLDLSGMDNGIYVGKLQTENGIAQFKIVINK